MYVGKSAWACQEHPTPQSCTIRDMYCWMLALRGTCAPDMGYIHVVLADGLTVLYVYIWVDLLVGLHNPSWSSIGRLPLSPPSLSVTTDVLSAEARYIDVDNRVLLTCNFNEGSQASGCRFKFRWGRREGNLSASVLVRWEGRVHVTIGAGHYRVPGTR